MVRALGTPPSEPIAGTGRLIRIGPADGPCVAVRAELDALPLVETTGVSWAAPAGKMHACGHDVHMAALTALCRAAATVPLPVGLLAVLQPREESLPSGAYDIVRDPAFVGHDVRAVIGAHVQPALAEGTVAAAPGPVNAAVDDFLIRVTGHPGHAAYPHLVRDPILTLAQIIVSMQQIVSRRTDPTHAAVVSVGVLQSGTAPGVVPAEALARGTLRTLSESDRSALRVALTEVVVSTGTAYGCQAEIVFTSGEPALVNDDRLARVAGAHLENAGFSVDTHLRSCGSDDFAFYSEVAPSLMMFVGVDGQPGTGLHHPGFLPGDQAVGDTAKALLAGYLAGCVLVLEGDASTANPHLVHAVGDVE
ncbi:amidohydrolase [Sphaerisporangium flaviroseum]|uniref:Amidohydrolase n=1 Tax=Sphaerisporangium flaviroseum TaxID=509199 RepID=A0ABP7HW14_9ACTN